MDRSGYWRKSKRDVGWYYEVIVLETYGNWERSDQHLKISEEIIICGSLDNFPHSSNHDFEKEGMKLHFKNGIWCRVLKVN